MSRATLLENIRGRQAPAQRGANQPTPREGAWFRLGSVVVAEPMRRAILFAAASAGSMLPENALPMAQPLAASFTMRGGLSPCADVGLTARPRDWGYVGSL